MTIAPSAPHVPGSLPFDDAEQGFLWAGRTWGDRLRRIPDGETEPLRRAWQPFLPWFRANPTIARGADIQFGVDHHEQYHLKEGVEPVFNEPFQYQEWALSSYEVFRRVRDAGGLPTHARLMVGMPSALDVVVSSVTAQAFRPVLDAYMKQLKVSIDTIVDAIPHEDLSFQLDSVVLSGEWTGGTAEYVEMGLIPDFGLDKAAMLEITNTQLAWIPEDVEVGFHLCFGDGNAEGHSEDFEPDKDALPGDIGSLVAFCNDIVKAAPRPITFLHLATYEHWLEPSAYAPLRDLDVGDAEISLGVICLRRDPDTETGVANARKRTESARSIIGDTFGIATTCGMGRFVPEQTDAAAVLFDELQPYH
ncbi:MAG TPA: hypothetical protein VNT22_00145 [Baekduia sp.]|nr:hypothetical protein [Baekduia sp.]